MQSKSVNLLIAALILTTALAVPAAAQKLVPFNGAMQGHETDTPQGGPPPTMLLADGSVRGIATLVGQFSLTYTLTVNLADGTATGSAQLIAANGDSMSTTIVGSSEPSGTPGVLSVTEINTVTGGTGRFAGATGSFTTMRLVNVATGLTSGSFHGMITSRGATH